MFPSACFLKIIFHFNQVKIIMHIIKQNKETNIKSTLTNSTALCHNQVVSDKNICFNILYQ